MTSGESFPIQDEHVVLMMARAGGIDGFILTDLSWERAVRAAGEALAQRGLVRIEDDRIFITHAGRTHSIGAQS